MWLNSFKEPKGQLPPLLETLQEYNVHHKGRNYSNADALSRLSVSGEEKTKTARILAVIVEQGTTMQDRQLQDSAIGPVLLAKEVNQYRPDKVKAFNMAHKFGIN